MHARIPASLTPQPPTARTAHPSPAMADNDGSANAAGAPSGAQKTEVPGSAATGAAGKFPVDPKSVTTRT